MADKDPFAEFGGTTVADPFSEFGGTTIVQKKSPSTNDSGTQSQQLTTPSSKSISPLKYTWSGASDKPTQEVVGTVEPVSSDQRTNPSFEKAVAKVPERNFGEYAFDKALDKGKAYVDYNENVDVLKGIEDNPQFKEYERLVYEFNNAPDAGTKEILKGQIDALKSQPFNTTIQPVAEYLQGDQGGATMSMAKAKVRDLHGKTFGEVLDAVDKHAKDAEKAKEKYDIADKDLQEITGLMQDATGFKANDKGIRELNWADSFIHGAVNTTESSVKGAELLFSDDATREKLIKQQLGEQQLLYPTQATGTGAEFAETVGGVVPYFVPGAGLEAVGAKGVTATMGNMFANSVLMGLSNANSGALEAYNEAKQQGLSDEEALNKANAMIKSGAIGGALTGAAMSFLPHAKIEGSSIQNYLLKSGAKNTALGGLFGLDRLIQNKVAQSQGLDRETMDGVGETIVGALTLGALFDGVTLGKSIIKPKTQEIYKNAIAKFGFSEILPIIDKGLNEGMIGPKEAADLKVDLQKRSEAFNAMPEDLTIEQQNEVLPETMQIQSLNKEIKVAGENGMPTEKLEAELENTQREYNEKIGSPLTDKEQKEYHDLKRRQQDAKSDSEAEKLDPLEKERLKHFEKRLAKAESIETEKDDAIQKQQERLGLPAVPEILLSDEAESILVKAKVNKVVPTDQLGVLTNELYRAYKGLAQTRDNANRRYTRKQIDAKLSELEALIEPLETIKSLQEQSGGLLTIDLSKKYIKSPEEAVELYNSDKAKRHAKGNKTKAELPIETEGRQDVLKETAPVIEQPATETQPETTAAKPEGTVVDKVEQPTDGSTLTDANTGVSEGTGQTADIAETTPAVEPAGEVAQVAETATEPVLDQPKPEVTAEITSDEVKRIEDAKRWSKPEFNKRRGENLTTDEYSKLRSTRYYKQEDKYIVKTPAEQAAQTQKSYQEIAGLIPSSMTGRIPVDPIVGGKPKSLSEIILDVTKGVKQRLFYSKPGKRRALGTYTPGNSAVKIKFNGDLDVTAHEVGHSIDDLFGVLSDLKTTPNPVIEAELAKFSPFGSKAPKGHPDPKMYKRAEGFAEWLRAYIVNPTQAVADAPELYKLYESKVHEDYRDALDNFSTDFRTWAGSSGRDMTLANIEFEPEKNKGIISNIFSKTDTNNQFALTFADRLAANFINPMRAFNKAFEYAKGVKGVMDVLPADNPEILSRLLLGIDGKYGEILEHGMIDANTGDVLKDAAGNPKNLKWLLEPLDNTDMSTIKEDMKDTVAYMVAERTVELANKFGRENVLSGIGGGVFKDIDVAKKTLNEFNSGDPARLARIQEAANRYRDLSDDILRYMVDKGRMSIEQYKDIKKNNLQYVAMQRVMETEPDREITPVFGAGGKLGSTGQPVKSIKGSTKEITNPYTSLIDTLYKALRESDRNDVLRSFRDMITEERGMYENAPKRFADIGVKGQQGDKNAITIFVDGKPEHWLFQEDIYKALKGLDSEGYKLPGVFTALPRALRWTVTNFPVFAARNFVRDFQDRVIKTEDKSGPTDLFGDKEHWRELARTGGLNSGFYMRDKASYYGLLEQAMDDMAKNKKFILADPIRLKEGWQGYKNLLGKSETVNRVAEYRAAYRQAKAKGMDDYNASIYAGYKSRDLMDFALMGHWMKVLNQLVPFSNASVQGLRKTAISATNNPAGFTARMLAYSVVPSIALWLWNHRNKEEAEQYESLPAYQRDMAWNIKIGDNKWLVMPKPYELSLAGAGIDRAMSKAYGNETAFDGYAGSVASGLLAMDEGALAGPARGAIEGIANYDFFRNETIVPPYEEPLGITLHKDQNASRLGQAIRDVSGIDARKIDHFIKSQFSYYGKAGLKLTDIAREDSRNRFGLEDLGFFKQTPAYNSPQVQNYIEYAQKWGLTGQKTFKDFKGLAQDYFTSKTDQEKEKKAKVLIEYADTHLKEWKATNVADSKSMAAEYIKTLPDNKAALQKTAQALIAQIKSEKDESKKTMLRAKLQAVQTKYKQAK